VRIARLAGVVALATALGLGAAFGWTWWQERPLREAERALEAGNAVRALGQADYYLDAHPGSGRAEAARARALAALGRVDEAVQIYERVGAAGPDDLLAWARAHLAREEWSRAASLLGQAARLRPDDPDALYELATSLSRIGRLAEATAAAERFAALPGRRAGGDVLLGAIQADAGDPESATEAFARTLALEPEGEGLPVPPAEFFQQYASVLVNLGRSAEAIPLLEKALAASPSAEAEHLIGTALAQVGDEEGATRHWKASLEIEPAGVTPREDLAAGAIARGDAASAREYLGPLESLAQRRAKTAYLFQRLAAIERDEAGFARWKATADGLRVEEDRVKLLERLMADAPTAYWSLVVRTHKFATLGRWTQAADLIRAIPEESDEHPFVAALRRAVRTQGPLPPLSEVPITSGPANAAGEKPVDGPDASRPPTPGKAADGATFEP
jgi:tetratricopeptide (TPR) repeat protein